MSDDTNTKPSKPPPEPRDNFTDATVEELAWRAGLRCSVPGCNKLCFGPAAESDKKFNQGTAAHIISASPSSGPRADSTKTSAERKAIQNGIWCCATHGRLIDSDEKRYPVDLLRRWKKEHEERILLEATQGLTGQGNVVSVTLENIGRFVKPQKISFGKKTLLFGNDWIGNQLVCDMVASLADFTNAEKWNKVRAKNRVSKVLIEALSGSRITWQLLFGDGITCNIDGNPVPTIFSGFRVLKLEKDFSPTSVEIEESRFGDDEEALEAAQAEEDNKALFDELVATTRLTRDGLVTILKVMSLTQGRFFTDVQFEGDNIKCRSFNNHYIQLRGLSSSERQLFMVDIFSRLAEYCARATPTILILSHSAFPNLDDSNLHALLNKLGDLDLECQLIVTLHRWPKEKINLENWRVWHLTASGGSKSPVEIKEW